MNGRTVFFALLLLSASTSWAGATEFVWGPGDVPEEFQPLWDLEKVHLPAEMTLDERDDSTGYDAKYYNIETQFFTSNHSVTGKVDMKFTVTAGPLSYINLNLRNNMVCDSAKVNGVTAAKQFVGIDGLRVTCPTPLAQGATATVTLWYHGIPVLVPPLDSGLAWGTHLGVNTIYSLSEPDAARTWWPCKDIPWDKADSVRMVWTVPSNLYATANGLLQGVTTPSAGWKAYEWKVRYPMTTYLVVVTATNFAHFRNWYVNAAYDSLPIDNYVYPEDSLDATLDFADVNQVLGYFASIYGEYPFMEEKFGHAAFGWSGGEEHQTITSIGANLITGTGTYHWLIVHEASHQWWGDMTTCATWMDIWLNEGFATYSDALWTQHAQGQTAFNSRMNSFRTTYLNSISSQGNFPIYNPSYMWGGTVYQKGAWIVHMLRYVLGETNFWDFWPEYRNRYTMGTVTTAEFQQTLEDVSGLDLDWFFNEWVYMAGYPDYHWGWNFQQIGGGQTQVNISIHQDQTITPTVPVYNMNVPFKIVKSAGYEMVYAHDSLATQNFSFVVTGTVTDLLLDPDIWILKTNTEVSFVPAPYTVTIAPVSPPVQIPASGGAFTYNVGVTNNQTTTQSFTAWIMTRQPGGIWSGPYLGPVNLTLPAGAMVSRQRTQNVPGSAPAGNYLYEVRVGTYPNIILGAANFPFVKLTTGDGPLVAGWGEYGENFEPYETGVSASPATFALVGAYPNPFNPSTVMSFELRVPSYVSLRVYDTAGRLVQTLVEGWREAGAHAVAFDGASLASGVYLYRLTAGNFTASGKMVLLK